jgi:hypothetical protein
MAAVGVAVAVAAVVAVAATVAVWLQCSHVVY